MKTIILSSAYFPPIEYFIQLLAADEMIIDTFETYKKQSYRNRCNIYTDKGLMKLSIPVVKTLGNHSKTNEIAIFEEEKQKTNHWKSLSIAYQTSPFFMYYADEIKEVLFQDFTHLFKLNEALLKVILKILEIDVKISYSNDFIPANKSINDFRFSISPKENSNLKFENYLQVFNDRHGFIENLSILDLLFNLGPEAKLYLKTHIESNRDMLS